MRTTYAQVGSIPHYAQVCRATRRPVTTRPRSPLLTSVLHGVDGAAAAARVRLVTPVTAAAPPALWGHMPRRSPSTSVPPPARRYAQRGVDRQRLRLRIDRALATRLQAAAAARRLSVNAFTEGLLADLLGGVDADQAAHDLPQPTGRVRHLSPSADPPTRATES